MEKGKASRRELDDILSRVTAAKRANVQFEFAEKPEPDRFTEAA